MRDLRKRSIIAIKIKPNDSKANDFHTALADYLCKELKYQGLNVKRNNINLKIKLEKLHHDKYDHIVIDCLAGKLFLRGKEVGDKFFGRLRRFEGSRPADAYHCVAQSATRIANRINKLINDLLDDNDEREIYGEEIERLDLRKQAKYETYDGGATDLGSRRAALCYINGDWYESPYTHAHCINEYLQDYGLGKLKDSYMRPPIQVNNPEPGTDTYLIKQNIQSLAFAHKVNDYTINLETDSLYNIDLNTVVKTLKQDYPECIIYNDNQYDEVRQTFKKIAKDLRKNAGSNTDMFNRKQAICYMDGEIYEGFTHAECIDKYLTDRGFEELHDIHYRPKLFRDVENIDDYEQRIDLTNIKEHINQIAFAHLINEGEVRLETDSLYNVDVNTVVSALKQEYPGAIIYDDNNYDSKTLEFKKIARDLRRKADIQEREKAILYADGELLEGWTHATCLNDYLINHNLGYISEKQYRPAISVNNPEEGTDEYIIQKNIKSMGFAHLINEGEVRVETNTLYNLNLNTFVSALKQKYPGAVIYDDTDYDPISDTYKKIAKKLKKKTIRILKDLRKKAYTNYNGRDNAILYIDGQIIEGTYHKNCIDKYVEENPNISVDNKSIAFAHKVNDYTINLDTSTMFNVDLNTVVNALKIKYPECEIFDDNEYDEIKGYKKLAKDLRKKAELIDAFMKKDSYIEIFLNPTNKEVEICKDAYFNGFRGVISHNGNMYIWGMDILHDSINDYAKINIDVNYIKFYVEGDIFYIYGNYKNKTSLKELKQYFEKFSNVFNSNYSYCLSGFNDYKELDIRSEQIYSYSDILNKI